MFASDVMKLVCTLFFFKAAIRKELNDFKNNEMEVHAESKHLTRYEFLTDGAKVAAKRYFRGIYLFRAKTLIGLSRLL